jgi:hypothetical protein
MPANVRLYRNEVSPSPEVGVRRPTAAAWAADGSQYAARGKAATGPRRDEQPAPPVGASGRGRRGAWGEGLAGDGADQERSGRQRDRDGRRRNRRLPRRCRDQGAVARESQPEDGRSSAGPLQDGRAAGAVVRLGFRCGRLQRPACRSVPGLPGGSRRGRGRVDRRPEQKQDQQVPSHTTAIISTAHPRRQQ